MAVRHGYGKIAGTDALVFAYDTGDTRNSYRGEPTTNLLNTVNIGSFSIETGATRTATGNTYLGFPTYNIATNPTEVFRSVYTNFTNVGTGTYAASIWYRNNGTSAVSQDIYFGGANRGTGGGSIPADGQWHRRVVIVTNPTDTIFEPRPYTLVEAAAPQVEYKSHATPFVNGTRSATQGLLDLTGNNTIDLSDVSFDSNAQMTFDGTNDFIDTGYSGGDIATPTLEAVVYRSTSTGRYEAIIQNNVATDDALYVYPAGNLGFWPCAASGLTVPTGQWSHVAVSYDGTNLTYIVNGTIQVVTATCTHITDWDFLRIGAHSTADSERWIGEIAVAKVYNRPLTASELLSNFRHYKNRFNIS